MGTGCFIKIAHLSKHQVISCWQWLQGFSPGDDHTGGLYQDPRVNDLVPSVVLVGTHIEVSKAFPATL